MSKSPRLPICVSCGESNGWLKTLLKSTPTSSFVLSLNLKNLRTPRFTPHVPGPTREFRFATAGLSKTSAPVVGSAKAAALKKRSPPTPAYGSPTTRGRKLGPLKSPTASTKPLAILPGNTGSQLLHVQNGVNPVPLLANMFQDIWKPPISASSHLDNERPYVRPRPNGMSYVPYETNRCRETNESRDRSLIGLNWL